MLHVMRAHLHALFTLDLQPGLPALADYLPEDPEHFGVNVQAFISSSPEGHPDSFDFLVCTPRWFADRHETTDLRRSAETDAPLAGPSARRRLLGNKTHRPTHERDPVLFGRGFVFVRRWDYARLEADVRELCERTEGPDWAVVATRLDRLLPWEFNYRYDQAVDQGAPFHLCAETAVAFACSNSPAGLSLVPRGGGPRCARVEDEPEDSTQATEQRAATQKERAAF